MSYHGTNFMIVTVCLLTRYALRSPNCLRQRNSEDMRNTTYKNFFEKKPTLLYGFFGSQLYRKNIADRARFLYMVRDLEDTKLNSLVSKWLAKPFCTPTCISSWCLHHKLSDSNTNCVIVSNSIWYKSSNNQHDRAQTRREMNLNGRRSDPPGLKMVLESPEMYLYDRRSYFPGSNIFLDYPDDEPRHLPLPTCLRDIYHRVMLFFHSHFDTDFSMLLHHTDTAKNDRFLNEDFQVFAKPFKGCVARDTKIVILEKTGLRNYIYSHVQLFEDLPWDKQEFIKDVLRNYEDSVFATEECFTGFIY